MEKARTLVVTVTAWMSFLASVWLLAFELVDKWVVFANLAIVLVAFLMVAVGDQQVRH